jgi:elongation factor P hydroxylase
VFRPLRFLLPLILTLAALTCTRTVLLQGYKNADTLLLMRTDSYFDLRSDQEAAVRRYIHGHFQWHRTQELPLAAAWLRDIEKRAKGGLRPADIDWVQDSALRMRDRLLGRIEPDAVDFLTTVNESQMVHFRAQFNKDSQEIIKELTLPPEQKAALRAKRLVEFTEFWTGSLNAEQKKKALEIGGRLPDSLPLRLAYRAHGMAELEKLVKAKADRARFREFLRGFWLLPDAKPDPVARQFSLQSWASFRTGMQEMDSILTAEQRAVASKRLLEFAQDLDKISRETQ